MWLSRLVSSILPPTVAGTFYVIIVIDTTGNIYEDGKWNNIVLWQLEVSIPPQADLVVKDIMLHGLTNTTYPGDTLTVNWRLHNQGDISAIGYLCDNIYISSDQVWDS